MTSQNDIRRELAVVAEQIANARAALDRDELFDMSGIPEKVRSVANAITDLPPELAAEMRPLLAALLNEFKDFSAAVRRKIAAIQKSREAEGQVAGATRTGT